MKDTLTKISAIFTGTATSVTLYSFYESTTEKNKYKLILEQLEKNKTLQELLNKKEYDLGSARLKIKEIDIQSYKNDLSSQLEEINSDREKLASYFKDLNNLKEPQTYDRETFLKDVQHRVDNIWRDLTKFNTKAEEFVKKMDDEPLRSEGVGKVQDSSIDQLNSFMENLPDFSQMLENWKLFLKTLTYEELGALAHFISSLFVLICLINIIMVIYGDYIIRFLKIETRFPKIAKFIQLRRQFQLYYMLLFFIPAILTLLAIMYINALIFFG